MLTWFFLTSLQHLHILISNVIGAGKGQKHEYYSERRNLEVCYAKLVHIDAYWAYYTILVPNQCTLLGVYRVSISQIDPVSGVPTLYQNDNGVRSGNNIADLTWKHGSIKAINYFC